MRVILFNHVFAARVADGSKRQTIRPPRKRPISPGDVLSLREWEGSPYRSPQRILRHALCSAVEPIRLDGMVESYAPLRVDLAGGRLWPSEAEAFARADGFPTAGDMARWWRKFHALPFEGEVIRWEVP